MQSNMVDTKNETVKKGSFCPFRTDSLRESKIELITIITIVALNLKRRSMVDRKLYNKIPNLLCLSAEALLRITITVQTSG